MTTPGDPLVIRVLTGTRAGAEAALPGSGRATVGHEYWHDVVVREDATRGHAVELDLGSDDVARLSVLDGEAMLLGSTLRAGDTAQLPPYVPVSLGGVAFAFGVAASDRWAEATAIATTAPATAEPDADAAIDPGLWASLVDGTRTRLGLAIRPAAVVGIIAAIVVAFAAGPAIDALQLGGGPADKTGRALAAAGFRNVAVREGANDEVLVSGYVPTEADRQRVQQLIDGQGLRATVSIETGEELARATADVARVNGVEARARTLGAGVVELSSAPLDLPGRQRVEALVRRDVPGLRKLIFRDDPAMETTESIKTVADVTKRVSSVVSGDPSYIMTADGARYFPGAIMPSGHRLVAITEQMIVLERNGRRIMLKF